MVNFKLNSSLRIFFITVGWLSFALGIAGVFLPVLPTTPFMLLAAACFDRGSPRFHAWLVNHRIFGPAIRDWKHNRAIRPIYKTFAGLMMGGSIVLVCLAERIPLGGKLTYAVFLSAVFAYIATRNNK